MEDYGTATVLVKDDRFDLVHSDRFFINPMAETMDIACKEDKVMHLCSLEGQTEIQLISDFFGSPILSAKVDLGPELINCWSFLFSNDEQTFAFIRCKTNKLERLQLNVGLREAYELSEGANAVLLTET